MILPVILAGGSGTRLWPLSLKNYPKQFLTLQGEDSMLQATIKRLKNLDHLDPLLICNEEHRFIAAEQLRQANLNHQGIILEPVGRNTAPAIALAAFQALKNNSKATLLILAADHLIEDEPALINAINQAEQHANDGSLVTFGIVPNKPETGFGYIKQGEPINKDACKIDSFVEKPDLATAKQYLECGDYLWNSGMFVIDAQQYLEELQQHSPEIYQACKTSMAKTNTDMDFIRVDKAAFKACPDDSIDYAVMEKTNKGVVVPLDAKWNDVGGFDALWQVSEKDENGNATKGDVVTVNTHNCLIHGDEKLVSTIGVEDLIIINTKDAVLVANKHNSQDVKKVIAKLQETDRPETTFHREVFRPWGTYDSIDNGERFQVKRISVKPGAKLSVQMHHHRAEHWIVVSGTAKVTNGDKTILLSENQSTYIPIGEIHALENPGVIPLELIEVQSGSYLGEDDIVRFEDRYGRTDK